MEVRGHKSNQINVLGHKILSVSSSLGSPPSIHSASQPGIHPGTYITNVIALDTHYSFPFQQPRQANQPASIGNSLAWRMRTALRLPPPSPAFIEVSSCAFNFNVFGGWQRQSLRDGRLAILSIPTSEKKLNFSIGEGGDDAIFFLY